MKKIKLLPIMFFALFLSCDKDDETATEQTIDLAANDISYTLVSQSSPNTGVVRITGYVKNIGNAEFNSSNGQQVAQLLEKIPGTTTFIEMAFEDLPNNIEANEEVSFSYEREWDTTLEFQNEIILRIFYDPDIFIDGNPNNDDADSTNNSLSIFGNAINSLF